MNERVKHYELPLVGDSRSSRYPTFASGNTEYFIGLRFVNALKSLTNRKICGLQLQRQNDIDCRAVEHRHKVLMEITQTPSNEEPKEGKEGSRRWKKDLWTAVEKKLIQRYSKPKDARFILLVFQQYYCNNPGQFFNLMEEDYEKGCLGVRQNIQEAVHQPFDEIWYLQLRVNCVVKSEKLVQVWPY